MTRDKVSPQSRTLINKFNVETRLSVHSSDTLDLEAVAHLDTDISSALPYLNAELNGARYTPSIPALIWLSKGRQFGIFGDRIAVDHVHEDEDADEIFEDIVNIINQIWSGRDRIQPRHKPRSFRQPLEIYNLLPRTNCQLCGESTCYGFALKLTTGAVRLAACTPLYTNEDGDEGRAALERLLIEKDPTR